MTPDIELALDDLILKYGEEQVYAMYGDILRYLENPNKFTLITEPELRVIAKVVNPNPGIKYLNKVYFNKGYKIGDFASDDGVKSYILNSFLHGKSTFFSGSNGIGKTTFSIACANYLYKEKKIKYLYVNWPDLINNVGPFNLSNDYLNQIKNASHLIIDDLGNENINRFTRDQLLFPIINYRMEQAKHTIIISNYELYEELPQRYMIDAGDTPLVTTIISKISGLCEQVELRGRNYRNGE